MTAHLTPGSGRKHTDSPRDFPQPRTGGYDTLAPGTSGLGLHDGESNPARMLSGVLILVIAAFIMALTLLWWLV